jgi:hypothetical protein
MAKIVINRCWGGYSLSEDAYRELGLEWHGYGFCDLPRDDPKLVATVEKLGTAANGRHAELSVVEIPDDVEWEIHNYDGMETVRERHRTWS